MLPFYLKKIWSIAQKILLVVTVYIIVVGLFFTFTKQDKTPKSGPDLEKISQQQFYSLINNPEYSKTKDKKIALTVLKSALCGSIGQACTNNPKDDQKNFSQSLLGMMTTGIMIPYINPPASGAYWAYSGLQKAGFVPKTYAAAGIGFSSISLFMPIWKAFRDVTYIFMVVILIAIGFMIMFRMKLNPQTVVNIENSLPKVVITMLMITFSFAIAGFMIDLMYILIILVIEIMSKAGNLNAVEQANKIMTGSALWSDNIAQFDVYFNGLLSLWQVIPNTIRGLLAVIINTITFVFILRFFAGHLEVVNGLLGKIEAGAELVLGVKVSIGGLISALIIVLISLILSPLALMALIFVVVIIGLLTLMFRIFFMLLYSYIQVIIYIMFAPVFLISEALPGQKGFEPWFKNILGNLMVFPITIALLLTIRVINQYAASSLVTDGLGVNPGIFLPPLLTGFNDYGASASVRPEYFIAIINAVFLMIIPDLAKSFKQMIIGKGGIQIPTNVGALWGGAGAGLSSGAGLLGQISSVNLGLTALGIAGKDNKSIFATFKDKLMNKR